MLTRNLSVLDTGAGPNFIRASDLPPGVGKFKYGQWSKVSDANNNPNQDDGVD